MVLYQKQYVRNFVKGKYKSLSALVKDKNISISTLTGHQKFHNMCLANSIGIDFGDITFMRIKNIKYVGKRNFYSYLLEKIIILSAMVFC